MIECDPSPAAQVINLPARMLRMMELVLATKQRAPFQQYNQLWGEWGGGGLNSYRSKALVRLLKCGLWTCHALLNELSWFRVAAWFFSRKART